MCFWSIHSFTRTKNAMKINFFFFFNIKNKLIKDREQAPPGVEFHSKQKKEIMISSQNWLAWRTHCTNVFYATHCTFCLSEAGTFFIFWCKQTFLNSEKETTSFQLIVLSLFFLFSKEIFANQTRFKCVLFFWTTCLYNCWSHSAACCLVNHMFQVIYSHVHIADFTSTQMN